MPQQSLSHLIKAWHCLSC